MIGQDAGWVEDRIKDGTVRPLRTKHDHAQLYLSEPMLRRLRDALATPRSRASTQTGWLRLGEAALEAGVTTATIIKWAECRELARVADTNGWRYPRDAVRARARAYWQSTRFRRATPPLWLQAETAS